MFQLPNGDWVNPATVCSVVAETVQRELNAYHYCLINTVDGRVCRLTQESRKDAEKTRDKIAHDLRKSALVERMPMPNLSNPYVGLLGHGGWPDSPIPLEFVKDEGKDSNE